MEKAKILLPEITYCKDGYEAAKGADAVLLLTEWEEFRKMDWCRLAALVERPLIIDGRNALRLDDLIRNGFEYIGIGGLSASPQLRPSAITA
jgi:UDPglucose 6-dehydrogenase